MLIRCKRKICCVQNTWFKIVVQCELCCCFCVCVYCFCFVVCPLCPCSPRHGSRWGIIIGGGIGHWVRLMWSCWPLGLGWIFAFVFVLSLVWSRRGFIFLPCSVCCELGGVWFWASGVGIWFLGWKKLWISWVFCLNRWLNSCTACLTAGVLLATQHCSGLTDSCSFSSRGLPNILLLSLWFTFSDQL